MSLIADAEALIRQRGTVCSVARVLAQLKPADADELRTLLADRDRFPATAIEAALALPDRDITLNAETINRHRRGRCACRG